MAMGTRQSEQASWWVATAELPTSPGHPFFTRLNVLLDAADFDRFVKGQCASFYAPVMGRPGLEPGRYFRLLLLGYFEGIDSEHGIALARDGLAGDPQFSAAALGPAASGSFDDLPDAARDRRGDPPRRLHMGAAPARGGGVVQGEDDRD
jgi:hypothetical protein